MRLLTSLFLSLFIFQSKAQEPEAVIPFAIKNGHMYIDLQINQSEPLHFVFDTGAAANLISDKAAASLNIEAAGSRSVQGASGSTTIKSAKVDEMNIQGVTFKNSNFLVMNIDHLSDEDHPLSGIIGAVVLNRFVVEIDYEKSEIKLFDRKGFEAPEGWTKQSFSLRPFGVPVISATITLPSGETLTGPYLVDTGAATTIKFNTPFVNKNKLIQKLGRHYAYTSRALSNKATDEVSKLPSYELFGQTFESFPVRLSQVDKGVSSYEQVDGILGLDLLKRFNTIYDYYQQAMYVKPNSLFDETFRLNHDGMEIEKGQGVFTVKKVHSGSASDMAGIQQGDQIISLDGKSAFSRPEFHLYIQMAKKSVTVKLKREGKELKVELKPKAML
ncbi:MAG: PDZ domain-containing protein [Roseivirga sp.]|nr:PDZ domain-containing protein [Roseivirga sp.]